jgi:hypothetical protein
LVDVNSGWNTVSPSMPAGAGFAELVFPVNSYQQNRMSVPSLRLGVRQIQVHRQNSIGNGLPIRVSEVALLVSAEKVEVITTGAFQDGRRRFT